MASEKEGIPSSPGALAEGFPSRSTLSSGRARSNAETAESTFRKRHEMLERTYPDDFPESLRKDVLSYTPKILHSVLEIDQQKALVQLTDDDIQERAVIESSVWASTLETDCSLMLADVSGFCKISEELCSQGVEGLDKLRTGINECFSGLIDIIAKYGGDILNFAGDALIIAWFDLSPSKVVSAFVNGEGKGKMDHGPEICGMLMDRIINGDSALTPEKMNELTLRKCLNAIACLKCGLELASTEPLFDTKKLQLHVGIASGVLHLYVAGGLQNEYQFLGISPLYKDMGAAVEHASAKELVIADSTYKLVSDEFQVQAVEGIDDLFKVEQAYNDRINSKLEELRDLEAKLGGTDYGVSHGKSATYRAMVFMPPPPQLDLLSPTPNVCVEAEIREVTVIFVKLDGLRIQKALNEESGNCQALIDNIVLVAQQSLKKYEAMLRQFLVDDKGMVMIFALGVPQCVHMDDPIRAVKFAVHCCEGLAKLDIKAYAGVTTGKAYCGLVGNRVRKEYALVGDTVNLAARLMAFGYKKFGSSSEEQKTEEPTESPSTAYSFSNSPLTANAYKRANQGEKDYVIICDEVTKHGAERVFEFIRYDNVKIKGKSNVSAYQVDEDGKNGSKLSASEESESWLVEGFCVGFDVEINYLKSILKTKDVKRRVSYLANSFDHAPNSRTELQKKLIDARPTYYIKNANRDAQSSTVDYNISNRGSLDDHHEDAEESKTRNDKETKQQHEKGKRSAGDGETKQPEDATSTNEDSDCTDDEEMERKSADDIVISKKGRRRTKRLSSFDSLSTLKDDSRRRISSRLSVFRKKGGSIILIRGEEGGGKSTFLNHGCHMGAQSGLCPVYVKLKPTEHYQPYAALSHILHAVFMDKHIRKIVSVQEGFFETVMKEWEESLTSEEKVALPEVKDAVLKVSSWSIAGWTPTDTLRSSNLESHDLIQQILLKLFTSPTFLVLVNEKLLVAIDDMHYMDSCSWEVLIRVIAAPSISLLIIGTSINVQKGKKLPAQNEAFERQVESSCSSTVVKHRDRLNVTTQSLVNDVGEIQTITLGRLSPGEISTIVRATFRDTKWSEEDLRSIFEFSVGHPYVAIELARGFRANRGLAKDSLMKNSSGTKSENGQKNPGTTQGEAIHKAFTARIDSLSNAEQRCLKAASVIGLEFGYETLIEIVPRSFLRLREDKTTQLDSILAKLVEAEFFRILSDGKDSETGRSIAVYEFVHSKLRQTCYSLLLRADQIMYHKQVANWLATKHQDDLRKLYVPLMYHLIRANDYDKAMDYGIGSIKSSVKAGAFSECRVILDECMSYVLRDKLKPRTKRMMINTMKHILNQHIEFKEQAAQNSANMSPPSSPTTGSLTGFSSRFANKRWSIKSHLPSARMIMMDENDDDSSNSSSRSQIDIMDDHQHRRVKSKTESQSSNENKTDVQDGYILGFKAERNKNVKKLKTGFWEYFSKCIDTIEETLRPKVDLSEQKQEEKTAVEPPVSGKSSSVCTIQ